MKYTVIVFSVVLLAFLLDSCRNTTSTKIKESLFTHYNKQGNKGQSLLIDSMTYTLADSTVYYNHLLQLLDQRSESFARMAALRTKLAKSHMDSFLVSGNKAAYLQEKEKINLDKSLEDLKNNERQWDMVNDSMDLLFNAIHSTDSTRKAFYKVSYVLKEVREDQKPLSRQLNAIINSSDFKVVFADE